MARIGQLYCSIITAITVWRTHSLFISSVSYDDESISIRHIENRRSFLPWKIDKVSTDIEKGDSYGKVLNRTEWQSAYLKRVARFSQRTKENGAKDGPLRIIGGLLALLGKTVRRKVNDLYNYVLQQYSLIWSDRFELDEKEIASLTNRPTKLYMYEDTTNAANVKNEIGPISFYIDRVYEEDFPKVQTEERTDYGERDDVDNVINTIGSSSDYDDHMYGKGSTNIYHNKGNPYEDDSNIFSPEGSDEDTTNKDRVENEIDPIINDIDRIYDDEFPNLIFEEEIESENTGNANDTKIDIARISAYIDRVYEEEIANRTTNSTHSKAFTEHSTPVD